MKERLAGPREGTRWCELCELFGGVMDTGLTGDLPPLGCVISEVAGDICGSLVHFIYLCPPLPFAFGNTKKKM